ncbi:unnamed protein product [Cladocopium goreaui]|uniref:Copia protein (Gag-int-pol protein) [Cleaved into: Copia VLP protein Copia protease ] n=1 Tax=Cladocopium goreaui TaxID=2562237 RepID=A0A9P1GTT5_9DINO|nr:unnamed protein product [Cladocopium goreaui]
MDDEKGSGAWSRVPTWDGDPKSWRAFKREMDWWLESLDVASTTKYNLAARWLLRQTGIVRQRGEEFSPSELAHQPEVTGRDPETGEDVVLTPADPLHGIRKLMSALESINGKTVLDKRGDLRNSFYLEMKRKPGERISEFCTRFRSAVADLRMEGVTLPSGELGWFLKQKLGLDAIRQQLLETALQGKETYEETEVEVLRLFRDLHVSDPLSRRVTEAPRNPVLNRFLAQQRGFPSRSSYPPSSAAASMSSGGSGKTSSTFASRNSTYRRPFPSSMRQANVTETEEDEAPEDEEEPTAEPEGGGNLEEVLQAEAEILATELEEALEDGVDADFIQSLEDSVESAAEALVTMREARHQLAEVKKDRGYGKVPPSGSAASSAKSKVDAKKSSGKYPCFDCGKPGHWAGDASCPNPGAGLGRKSARKPKSVKVVESLNTEHVVDVGLQEPQEVNEVLTVSKAYPNMSIGEALDHVPPGREVNAVHVGLAQDKRLVGALDSAGNRTVTGPQWLNTFIQALQTAPSDVQALVQCTPENETFRFGDGGTQVSRERHYLLPLLPPSWRGVGTQRWRKLGIDGVVELQMSTKEWLRRKLGSQTDIESQKGSHEHFLTERSLKASLVVHDFVDEDEADNVPTLVQDLRMTRRANSVFPTSSSPASSRPSSLARRSERECLTVTHGNAGKCGVHAKVAKIRSAPRRKIPMALFWTFALACAASRTSASPLSVPFSSKHTPVGDSGLGDDGSQKFAKVGFSEGAKGRQLLVWLQIKRDVIKEAQQKAVVAFQKGKAEDEARSLIGPRGGLPTLRQDLVRLAALLKVNVTDKMTVPEIKEAVRPSVELLKNQPKSKAQAPAEPRFKAPPAQLAKAPSVTRSSASSLPLEVQSQIQVQQKQFQEMMNQVAMALTQLHQGHGIQSQGAVTNQFDMAASDVMMADQCDDGMVPSQADWDRINAEGYQDLMEGEDSGVGSVNDAGPWELQQDLKRGQAKLIADAWNRHMADCKRVSQGRQEIRQVMLTEFEEEMRGYINDEPFVHAIDLSTSLSKSRSLSGSSFSSMSTSQPMTRTLKGSSLLKSPLSRLRGIQGKTEQRSMATPLVSEVYTNTQRVMKEAARRGHRVGTPMSLETGWNFLNKADREEAKRVVRSEKPLFLMLAFPCGPFSPLQRLNPSPRLRELQDQGRVLMDFALELAQIQLDGGRHYVLENPKPSGAWKGPRMLKFLASRAPAIVDFDQCRLGLRSRQGNLHRKPTRLVSSSFSVASKFEDQKCTRTHLHDPVIGGVAVTARAGHYPVQLAKCLVKGMEEEFNKGSLKGSEVLAVGHDEGEDDFAVSALPHFDSDSEIEEGIEQSVDEKIPASVKATVARLHENTGHRSNRRLARALTLAGAPAIVVRAAKEHKCSICLEKVPPKPQRPASLPHPRDVSDQVHCDLLEAVDSQDNKYVIIHALLAATVSANSVIGKEEMSLALGEALSAYNNDTNDSGVSPAQAALGKAPRLPGDVLTDIQGRLAEHDLVTKDNLFARQLALRETAKVAMTRLHFSRGLRRAELARNRSSTIADVPAPGDIVYFFRFQKYNNKLSGSRKRLSLRRWHGPALLVAVEKSSDGGDGANGYLSFKGQLTKCSLEHIRRASPMEQITTDTWRDAIEDAVCQAVHDMTLSGLPSDGRADPTDGIPATPAPSTPAPATPMLGAPSGGATLPAAVAQEQALSDLPPVQPQEVVGAVQASFEQGAIPSQVGSLSRRQSSEFPAGSFSRRQSAEFSAPATPLTNPLPSSSAMSQRMSTAIERVREMSGKRASEVAPEQLRLDVQQPEAELPDPSALQAGVSDGVHDALMMSKEEIFSVLEEDAAQVHPLVRLHAEACGDRLQPLDSVVRDHGTWRGDWQLPSQTEWSARQKLGCDWPCGQDDFNEAMAVQTARKEYFWSNMNEDQKEAYRKAADAGWNVWVANDAVEVLPDEEAARVRSDLKKKKEECKILTPRWVFTDKHDGLRTPQNNLELKANARLVVPGFKDVMSYGMRKDAPTASRTSQHLVFTLTASYHSARGWRLLSVDVKSAFMKGDPYLAGTRELFVENVKSRHGEPMLPFSAIGLAKVKKGVFGLSDAPRQWYLRLHRALTELGWIRSTMDAACWFLWGKSDSGERILLGVVLSHVDDLLCGGCKEALDSIMSLEAQLGFGTVERDSFVYCGKKVSQDEHGVVHVTMPEYHANLQPVSILPHRKRQPDAELTDGERRQLRAILGSLQWLVAQVRVDQGFALSTLQGEKPTIGTLLRANILVKNFKSTASFGLRFYPMSLKNCGIMVVSDASLGNVTKDSGTTGDVPTKVYSQASYVVLLAEEKLMKGETGRCCLLDARSHRLQRVCRSTFAAELLGTEEAFDVGQYCRGLLASISGYPLEMRHVDTILDAIPLTVVVDAKDVFDKCLSDTPSYGSQKSLAFTVAWIRTMLRRPNTSLRWTSTENMFVDGGTKEMDLEHMREILTSGEWCPKYTTKFIKQSSKGGKTKPLTLTSSTAELPGQLLSESHAIFPYLHRLGETPGWHFEDRLVMQVARNANPKALVRLIPAY